MTMRIGAAVAALLLLSGCEREADRQKKLELEARAALDEKTRDPIALQVRKLLAKDKKTLCGEVNIKRDGEYEGFQVFVVNRETGRSIVAEPTAVQSVNGEVPIEQCADATQKAKFEKEKAVAKAEFDRELKQYTRETELIQLKANAKLKAAQAD